MFFDNRLQCAGSLSSRLIRAIVADEEVKVLQFNSPIDKKSWHRINDKLLPKRPDIQIRLYGYLNVCDLSVLQYIPNVEHLAINCLLEASNIETITTLRKLKSLSIGILSLLDFSFLQELPLSLERLTLGATKSKRPNLRGIERFSNLKKLYIERQNKDLELLAQLSSLEELVLRSISVNDIHFIQNIPRLRSLTFELGGIKDFSPLCNVSNIKRLEIVQVRELADISFISSLSGLESLWLQSLRNVTSLPDLSKLHNLTSINLENMKGLVDLSSLIEAPALKYFNLASAKNMTPEQYVDFFKAKTLKRSQFEFGDDRSNKEMEK